MKKGKIAAILTNMFFYTTSFIILIIIMEFVYSAIYYSKNDISLSKNSLMVILSIIFVFLSAMFTFIGKISAHSKNQLIDCLSLMLSGIICLSGFAIFAKASFDKNGESFPNLSLANIYSSSSYMIKTLILIIVFIVPIAFALIGLFLRKKEVEINRKQSQELFGEYDMHGFYSNVILSSIVLIMFVVTVLVLILKVQGESSFYFLLFISGAIYCAISFIHGFFTFYDMKGFLLNILSVSCVPMIVVALVSLRVCKSNFFLCLIFTWIGALLPAYFPLLGLQTKNTLKKKQ